MLILPIFALCSFMFIQRIELDMEVDFIYGTEQNPCSGPVRNDWLNWIVGKDSRSRCRDFLA